MTDLTPVVIDLETYFDDTVSLRKLTLMEYIRHPAFKVHGLAIKVGDQPAQWCTDVADTLSEINWNKAQLIHHNYLFDGTVLFEKYGVVPAQRVDTLGLCRALLPRDMDFGIDALGKLFNLGGKTDGGSALKAVKGVTTPTQSQLDALGVYARQDAEITHAVFHRLWPMLPDTERRIMNLTLRFSTQGVFVNSPEAQAALQAARQEIEDHRNELLKATGLSATTLRSRDKFAQALVDAGVAEPPRKISPTTNKETWAFSKTDPEFLALKAHPQAGPLVEARLAWASNSAVKRTETISRVLSAPPHTLPAMLQYAGAKTGRYSGSVYNLQNLNARGRGAGIRHAIRVRDGFVIIAADLAGIELRTNLWLAGQDDAIEMIKSGQDLYIQQAAMQLRKPESEITKENRQLGKVIELGLGYGMGHQKFQNLMATGPMGAKPMFLETHEAYAMVQTYRALRDKVSSMWRWLNDVAIPYMASSPDALPMVRGPLTFVKDAMLLGDTWVINYPNLHLTEDGWVYGTEQPSRLYGALCDENAVQGLAALIIKDQMLQIDNKFNGDAFMHGYHAGATTELRGMAAVVMNVHDEILVVCREEDVDTIGAQVADIMRTGPAWTERLPLDVEWGAAQEYSK